MSWLSAWRRRREPKRVAVRQLYPQLIARFVPGKTVLDIGCMWNVDGAYAFHAVDQGAAHVVGLDVEPATPQFLAENGARNGAVRFVHGDVNDSALDLGRFEVVFCTGVLYHVPNPLLTLGRLRELCGGRLILATAVIPEHEMPNVAVFLPHLDGESRRRLNYSSKATKRGLDTAYAPEKGYGNWFWGLTPSCVLAMLETVGFQVIERHDHFRNLTVVCIPQDSAALAAPATPGGEVKRRHAGR